MPVLPRVRLMYGVTCLCEEGAEESCTLLGWATPTKNPPRGGDEAIFGRADGRSMRMQAESQ